ncbi:MAG: hypothetical protein ACO1SV_07960 [Fimbriimonas sp.]
MSILLPRGYRPLVALLLIVLSPLGFAGTLPAPTLRERQFVYRIPSGFIPEGLSERGLGEIQESARRLHYPFYVVFVQKLPTVTGSSTDDDTERAVVGLAEDWARDPQFDRNRATLFLVSYGPGDRKYKMLPAPRWRAELGLESEALVPYTQIFRNDARQDPQSALTRMMAAFDGHVYDNADPARQAQKAEERRRQQEAARVQAERSRAEREYEEEQRRRREAEEAERRRLQAALYASSSSHSSSSSGRSSSGSSGGSFGGGGSGSQGGSW